MISLEDIDTKKVRFFGTEGQETFFKDSSFKGFKSRVWIKDKDDKKTYVDCKFSELRRLFEKYSTIKTLKQKENKRGKLKKVYEWQCKVELKNSIIIPDLKKAKIALQNKLILYIPTGRKIFFFVWGHFFKDNSNDQYVYMDLDNECFRETGLFAGQGNVRQSHLVEWEAKHIIN